MKLPILTFVAFMLLCPIAMAANQVVEQCPDGWITLKRQHIIANTNPANATRIAVGDYLVRSCTSLAPVTSQTRKQCALYLKSGEAYFDTSGNFTVTDVCLISGL